MAKKHKYRIRKKYEKSPNDSKFINAIRKELNLTTLILSIIGAILLVILIALILNLIRNEEIIENKILVKINKDRLEMGKSPLLPDDRLTKWSKRHSNMMLFNNFFGHSDYNVGENILDTPVWFSTKNCPTVVTNEQIAQCIVNKWKISPKHFENMFDNTYSITGVGVACDTFKCVATQQFR
jgi:uncharacterized protein YkwD